MPAIVRGLQWVIPAVGFRTEFDYDRDLPKIRNLGMKTMPGKTFTARKTLFTANRSIRLDTGFHLECE